MDVDLMLRYIDNLFILDELLQENHFSKSLRLQSLQWLKQPLPAVRRHPCKLLVLLRLAKALPIPDPERLRIIAARARGYSQDEGVGELPKLHIFAA